jgi:hypothetical protein
MMRRFSRIIAVGLGAFVLTVAYANVALADFSTDHIYWDRFETSCGNCVASAAAQAWGSSDPKGNAYPLSVAEGNPGCDTYWWPTTSDTSNNANYYFATVSVHIEASACGQGGNTHWKIAWSHQ